jgi:hypothetical protein
VLAQRAAVPDTEVQEGAPGGKAEVGSRVSAKGSFWQILLKNSAVEAEGDR